MPFAVLGPLLPATVTRPAQRRLLSILLLEPGATVDRDLLTERMWAEPPASARNAIHVHVNGLRAVLGSSAVATEGSGYRADPGGLDRLSFERLSDDCRRAATADDRLSVATEALALWRGAPYPDLADDHFAWPTIDHLSELRLELEERRLGALLDLGRSRDVIAPLRSFAADHPAAEELRRLLMLALYREGRQVEALREYRSIRRHLGERAGLEPGPVLRDLEERILLQDPTLGTSADLAIPHNLPATTTSFVGRDVEVDGLLDVLLDSPVVTVVGGPGFGKTRLAMEVAHSALGDHPDGVWFASLTDATGRRDIMAAIARAMPQRSEVSSPRELGAYLATRHSLLVLDNCEHVIGPCREFLDAVASSGGPLRVLATSRRPISLPAEVVWRLAPLPVPAGTLPLAADNPAVTLFVDRARAVDRSFSVSRAVLPDLADLTRRLAGIPLAIELAARWVPALPLSEISATLDPVDGSGSPAAKSLRSALEWSLSLLPPDDRSLAEDLAVFRSGFDLDDAQAVCAGAIPRAPFAAALARLIDASLVVAARRHDGSIRYRMLVPIRDFLRERRATNPVPIEDGFAHHFLALAAGLQQDIYMHVVDLAPIDAAIDNVRAALEIGIERGWSAEVAAAVVPVAGFFHQRVLAGESREWLTRTAAMDLDPSDRVAVLRALGSAEQVLGHVHDSVGRFEEAVSLAGDIGDEGARVRCLLSLAGALSARGRWADGAGAATEALSILGPRGSHSAIGMAEYYLGETSADAGAWPGPVDHFATAARRFERAGELGRAAYALARLARAAALAGDETTARESGERAASFAAESGSEYRVSIARAAQAMVASEWGDPEDAARLLLRARGGLETNRPDGVVEVALPTIRLLHRLGADVEVARLTAGAREVMDGTELAIPEPWQREMATWEADAPGLGAADVPASVETLLDAAMSALGAPT